MLYVINVFLIQTAVFWLLFKIFGQSAKDRLEHDRINQPLVMASAFWFLTWVFGILSVILTLIYYLNPA